jgi:hypothetical protein
MKTPKVVVLCGSSRFCDVMAVCAWLIERDERAITMGQHLLPQWYPEICEDHLAEKEGVAEDMDRLHLWKIDLADEVFVVDRNFYTGDSTKREVRYALDRGIRVRWYTQDAVGRKVENMLRRSIAKVPA